MSGQIRRSRFAIVPMLDEFDTRFGGGNHRRPDIEAVRGHQFEWSVLVDGGNDALILYQFDDAAYESVSGIISDEKMITADPAIIRAWAAPLMKQGERYPKLDDVLGDKPQGRDVLRMAAASTLIDNFNDNSIDSGLWDSSTANGGTVTETGGQLVCTVQDNTDNSYGGLISKVTYSLDESSCFVKVLQIAVGEDLVETYLVAGENNAGIDVIDDDSLRVFVTDDPSNIYFQYRASSSSTTLASATYSDSTHLYWRLRESSGTTYWDTSADGSNWTNRASVSTATHGIDHTTLYLSPSMREYDPAASIVEDTAIFDDFNVAPVAGGILLPMMMHHGG